MQDCNAQQHACLVLFFHPGIVKHKAIHSASIPHPSTAVHEKLIDEPAAQRSVPVIKDVGPAWDLATIHLSVPNHAHTVPWLRRVKEVGADGSIRLRVEAAAWRDGLVVLRREGQKPAGVRGVRYLLAELRERRVGDDEVAVCRQQRDAVSIGDATDGAHTALAWQ